MPLGIGGAVSKFWGRVLSWIFQLQGGWYVQHFRGGAAGSQGSRFVSQGGWAPPRAPPQFNVWIGIINYWIFFLKIISTNLNSYLMFISLKKKLLGETLEKISSSAFNLQFDPSSFVIIFKKISWKWWWKYRNEIETWKMYQKSCFLRKFVNFKIEIIYWR